MSMTPLTQLACASAVLVERRAALDRREAAAASWRHCEYCGCKTNAKERICCQPGRQADRLSWDPCAADETSG